jgi:hypothetical protein
MWLCYYLEAVISVTTNTGIMLDDTDIVDG